MRRRNHREMPVRSKQEDIDSGDDSPLSEKDSDYVTKAPKVWSRELRNRFIISSGKRSLRFDNADGPKRRSMRSCRMTVLSSTTHYTLSQTDDEDDRIFTPRPRRLRLRHSLRRTSPQEHRPNQNSSQAGEDGIRRSTRVRKLKYDNYSDSWIVGSQTLRGYPSYGTPYPKSGKVAKDEEDDDDEEEEEEEEEEEVEVEPKTRLGASAEGGGGGGGGTTPAENGDSKIGAQKKVAVNQRRPPKIKKEDNSSEIELSEKRRPQESNYQDRYRKVTRTRPSRPKSDSSSDCDSSTTEGDTRRRRLGGQGEKRVERKYHLRQNKPVVDRFQAAEPDKRRSARVLREVMNSVRKRRRRSSSSSGDSSSSAGGAAQQPQRFDRKKGKAKSRNRMELCGAGGVGVDRKASGPDVILADVAPVVLDRSIRFANVGGLDRHVTCLKEMVVFPMLYAEVFARFEVTPPKGVLFHGPPGTGKTLVARALANECGEGSRKVSFFMRKGADCLSKWVGESERQLRLLFEEAKQARPSIIFFDELDGLAPVRSSKQDQIHASIVCTLLALMDGLDNRGDIVVIGATNRIDSIDPALRRPGRFDRELYFPLPGVEERREILTIHCGSWGDALTINKMAELTAGYCGSDIKALCTEAVIQALKRVYPQIYSSDQRLVLDPGRVKVERVDFERAHRGIVPASQRAVSTPGRKLPQYLEPLLGEQLGGLLRHIADVFPPALNRNVSNYRMVWHPRLLLVGQKKQTVILSTALLYKLEHCPILSIGLEALYSDSSRSPEETIIKVFKELPHTTGSILWFGDIQLWWSCIADSVKAVFLTMNSLLDPGLAILYLATCTNSALLPPQLQAVFSSNGDVFTASEPTAAQREAFLRPLFRTRATRPPPPQRRNREELETLEVAPPPPPPKMSEEQLSALYDEEENTLRELRIFLRQICAKLARNKQFYMFSKPVDINEVPDYLQIIKEPMDLETMMTKIDLHKYTCAQDFLNDVDLLCRNALEYNPDRDPADKLIRHRACFLRDTAYALIKAEMDSDFEISCRSIRDSRQTRVTEVPPDEKFVRQFFPMDQIPGDDKSVHNEGKTGGCADSGAGGGGGGAAAETCAAPAPSAAAPGGGGSSSAPPPTEGGAETKKRRRRQTWSKGCAGKRVRPKSSTATPVVSKGKDSSGQASSAEKGKNRTQDSSDAGAMVNGDSGCLNDSLDTAHDGRTCSTPGSNQGKSELIVNRVELGIVLEEAVNATSDKTTLVSLIGFYSELRRIIDSYSRLSDRTNLPQDLRAEIRRFSENHKSCHFFESEDLQETDNCDEELDECRMEIGYSQLPLDNS